MFILNLHWSLFLSIGLAIGVVIGKSFVKTNETWSKYLSNIIQAYFAIGILAAVFIMVAPGLFPEFHNWWPVFDIYIKSLLDLALFFVGNLTTVWLFKNE